MAETAEEWKARVGVGRRQVGSRHRGTDRTTVVPREDNGKPAGRQIEHWDGRQSAVAFAPTVTAVGNTHTRGD